MKLKYKGVLVCALAAGLTTFGAGKAQALISGGDLVKPLNVRIAILTTTSNGKVQKVRVTSKDLVMAISNDTSENLSGDQIVQLGRDGDCYLMDKHNNLGEDLSTDGFLDFTHSVQFENQKDKGDGSYKYSETGFVFFYFTSDGATDSLDSSLWIYDGYYSAYSYAETGSRTILGKQMITVTEKDAIGGDSHDDNISLDTEHMPVSGSVSVDGSSIFTAP